jgi:PAS domain S-box-containing protein
VITRTAADRIATLAARAAQVPISLVGTVDGDDLRIIGGYGMDRTATDRISLKSALTAVVIETGEPLVFRDTTTDPRIPADAEIRSTPARAFVAHPVIDTDGQVVGVCCLLDTRPRDWTEQELAAAADAAQTCTLVVAERRARQEVERQRRFLDAVLDNLHDGVSACDAQGRLVLRNSRMQAIRGTVAPTADGGDPLRGLLHADGTPVSMDTLAMTRALRGERIRGEELVVESPGHRRRRYQVAGGPITGPDGELLGGVVALHDVTRRRRAERFRTCELAVVRALGEADTVEQAGPRVLEAVATTLGWPHAELWLVDPDARVLRPAGRWSRPGPGGEIELPEELPFGQGLAGRAWQAGKPLWIRDIGIPQSLISAATAAASRLHTALAVPVNDTTGTVAVLNVFADVVEDPEEELVALMGGIAAHIGQFLGQRMVTDLQRQLTRSKDEYLALVGHELRTPLTSISAYTELLREADSQTLLEHGPAMIEVIDRNTTQLRQIIDELLELSALDTGHAPLQAVPCDLAAVVRESVESAGRPAAANGAALTVDADLPPELIIPGDAYRLRQVVDNLLGNAVKYSPDGGRITVRLRSTETTAILTVSDTGMGIAPAEREKLFNRLHRATEVREKAIPGSGLGLALSRAVVERHHGTIALEPHDGPGTTVALRLPAYAR